MSYIYADYISFYRFTPHQCPVTNDNGVYTERMGEKFSNFLLGFSFILRENLLILIEIGLSFIVIYFSIKSLYFFFSFMFIYIKKKKKERKRKGMKYQRHFQVQKKKKNYIKNFNSKTTLIFHSSFKHVTGIYIR